ncbi:uncharacterized protein MONBRDRAFT_13041 [Monosiga brevicollis MX1]|uniref:VOC domain-containing protein n=1 Tax=Monosiga brevicollis TaxID=81824 RepID=A9VE44_MONBE|nr:uncharacterized protein MONBRDRAFT_13041 [Monosiga brevicollis MX1]EDQ84207.1 predicted protein [Monosiga brevicollis MX1]|eukprot:XP_001750995.1 hypothetical protein [Monosiga brevicollis MX1]
MLVIIRMLIIVDHDIHIPSPTEVYRPLFPPPGSQHLSLLSTLCGPFSSLTDFAYRVGRPDGRTDIMAGGAAAVKTVLASALVLVRSLPTSRRFFETGLNLPVLASSENQVLLDAGATQLVLREVPMGQEAVLSNGYSPFLNFEVADLDTTMYSLLELGAHLDGRILYETDHKLATLRSPDGVMIGLLEVDKAAIEIRRQHQAQS